MMNPFAKPPTISDDFRSAELYREAADVFFEKGFATATMADVAAAVDLTKGGLYYYIQGKKALLYAIMSYGLDLVETEVLGPARRLEDPEESLRALVGGYLDLVLEESSVMALLDSEDAQLEPGYRAKVRTRKNLFATFLGDVFEAVLAAEGHGGMVDPRLAADSTLALLSSVREWDPAGTLDREETVTHIVENVRQSLIAPDTPAAAAL